MRLSLAPLILTLALVPGCVFCPLDVKWVTVSGIPAGHANLWVTADRAGTWQPMPTYHCKVFCSESIGWTEIRRERRDRSTMSRMRWDDAARYGVIVFLQESGWYEYVIDADAVDTQFAVPFFTCSSASIDLSREKPTHLGLSQPRWWRWWP